MELPKEPLLRKLKFYNNRFIVDWIKMYLFDEYPDLEIEGYVIEAILLGLIDYVKTAIEAEYPITITSLGKFYTKKKPNRRDEMQYYVKFKASRHLVLSLRESKGTLTDAEKREIIKKREFVQGVWERKQARLKAREANIRKDNIPDVLKDRYLKRKEGN